MYIGTMLLLIGVLHISVSGLLYRAPLADMLGAGVLASVPDFGDRATAFWFTMTGVCLLVLGACLRELEHRDVALPRVLAPGLWLLAALIVIPMPNSGGWLFAPIAWLAHRRRASGCARPR